MKSSITYKDLGEILGEAFEDAKKGEGRLAIISAKNGFLAWSNELDRDSGEHARNTLQDAFHDKVTEIRRLKSK